MHVGNIKRISVLHCPFICLGPTHYETSSRPGAVRGSILKRICGGCHRPGLLPGGREMLLRLSESRSHVRDLQDGVRGIEMVPGYDNVETARKRTPDGLPGPETHYHRATHGRPAEIFHVGGDVPEKGIVPSDCQVICHGGYHYLFHCLRVYFRSGGMTVVFRRRQGPLWPATGRNLRA